MARKIAIVGGVRTPFLKTDGRFADLSAVELGRLAAREAIARSGADPATIGGVIIGSTGCRPPEMANIARLVALAAGIPETVPAHTVHRDCASSLQALISGAQAIATGEAELVAAGGVESMSNGLVLPSERYQEVGLRYLRSRSGGERLASLLGLRSADFRPRRTLPQGLTDRRHSLDPGETAELLARELAIGREAQDEYALASRRRAAAAQAAGRFKEEIMTVLLPPDYQEEIDTDDGGSPPAGPELLAGMDAAVDPRFGTVTAGNTAQGGDGATLLLLAGDKAVSRYGLTPLGYLTEHVCTGLDQKYTGLGGAVAAARLMEQTGHRLADFGLIEMHETSAAQIIASEKIFADEGLARRYLHTQAPGRLDRNLVNVNGGAIALGHPVGATGARLVLTLLLEMRRRKVDLGLVTLAAGGGQGAALIIERGRL